MTKTIEAIFDGQVFRPDVRLNFKRDKRYRLKVEEVEPVPTSADVWETLAQLTGAVEAPVDWACEHDYYLYGTPKKL